MKLYSIAREAADCRAAWKAAPDATYGWHIHHETLAESLSEPIENRIAYILRDKPKGEQALRLRLMRPVSVEGAKALASAGAAYDKAFAPAQAAYDKALASARAAYNKALASIHATECPDCPWDSVRRTIFGGAA